MKQYVVRFLGVTMARECLTIAPVSLASQAKLLEWVRGCEYKEDFLCIVNYFLPEDILCCRIR